MKATVHLVATYHRWGGELHAFDARSQAEECVMEYAREFWGKSELGPFPASYARLHDAWGEHDPWGSVESRGDLVERQVDLPDLPPASAHR